MSQRERVVVVVVVVVARRIAEEKVWWINERTITATVCRQACQPLSMLLDAFSIAPYHKH